MPQCKVASWDIKTCMCSLRAAADGTPCDDGEACTVGDHCEAGICLGGVPDFEVEPADGWSEEGAPLLPQNWRPGAPTVIYREPNCRLCNNSRAYLQFPRPGPFTSVEGYDVAVSSDGDVWVVGGDQRLSRYDEGLSLLSFNAAASTPLVHTRSLQILPSGPAFMVGAGMAKAATGEGWLAGYGALGNIVWEFHSAATPGIMVLGLAVDSAGTMYALGVGVARAFLLVVSPAGKLVRQIDLGAATNTLATTYGTVRLDDTEVVVSFSSWDAERLKQGEQWPEVAVARLKVTGEVVWRVQPSAPELQSRSGPLVALPSGYLAVGWEATELSSTAPRILPFTLWHLDQAGGVRSARAVQPPWPDAWQVSKPFSAKSTPDGGALIVGSIQRVLADGETADAFLMKLDAWANPEWMRFYGGPHSERVLDAVFSAEGTITAVGGVVTFGDDGGIDRFILRTDFWGRTCGMRLGVCADVPWQDCEDGNPCTINWCDPDAGCTHPALPDGSPCGEGLTCQGAVCK